MMVCCCILWITYRCRVQRRLVLCLIRSRGVALTCTALHVLLNAGAILLSRALREHSNPNLAELDLGYNEVKDEGACALAQALKANPDGAPKELKVNANYITRFGQVALTEALDQVYDFTKKDIVITM
jgi:hypothetical protein